VTDDFKIQVSYKVGLNQQDMVNIRANSAAELQILLSEIGQQVGAVAATGDFLRAGGVVNTTFPGATQLPAATQLPENVVPFQQPAVAPAAQVPGTDVAPRICAHGPRVRKEGNTNGRKWVAYFCSLPKGSPGACEAEWVR
jgi:hypothetical protein